VSVQRRRRVRKSGGRDKSRRLEHSGDDHDVVALARAYVVLPEGVVYSGTTVQLIKLLRVGCSPTPTPTRTAQQRSPPTHRGRLHPIPTLLSARASVYRRTPPARPVLQEDFPLSVPPTHHPHPPFRFGIPTPPLRSPRSLVAGGAAAVLCPEISGAVAVWALEAV
jgi:hypothetical protein